MEFPAGRASATLGPLDQQNKNELKHRNIACFVSSLSPVLISLFRLFDADVFFFLLLHIYLVVVYIHVYNFNFAELVKDFEDFLRSLGKVFTRCKT